MTREELSLWWAGETDSIFVLYLTGAMSLSFLVTVAISRSLRRKEPRITELLHEDSLKHMMMTYLLCISTSWKRGTSCPDTIKVFMQLVGEHGGSQFFRLKSQKGGRPMFKRGFFDIFLFKVPVSLGKPSEVKLILSGADKSLSWKITRVQLYDPATKELRDIQTNVMATEIIGYGNANQKILSLHRPYDEWVVSVCIYHQWLSGFVNSVRIGAYTETVHMIAVFATLFNLLVYTQMAYIVLPGGLEEEQFQIQIPSLLMGSFIPVVVWTTLFFIFEFLIRISKCYEKNPGNAYLTVINENICSKRIACIQKKAVTDREGESNIWTTFVLKAEDLDNYMVSGSDSDNASYDVPDYLTRLIAHIEREEDRLIKLAKERELLLQQGQQLLNFSKASDITRMSFMTCIQSVTDIFQREIDLPSFSQVFMNRILSGKSLVQLNIDTNSDFNIAKLGHKTSSYFDKIRGKKENSLTRLESYSKDSAEALTLELTMSHLKFLAKSSSGNINTPDRGVNNAAEKSSAQCQAMQDRNLKTKQDHCLELPHSFIESELDRYAGNISSQEHIIEIEDIKVEDSTGVSDIKIDMSEIENVAGVRRRHLDKLTRESGDTLHESYDSIDQGNLYDSDDQMEIGKHQGVVLSNFIANIVTYVSSTDKNISFQFCSILSSDISLETSFQDISNDMSHDMIGQK